MWIPFLPRILFIEAAKKTLVKVKSVGLVPPANKGTSHRPPKQVCSDALRIIKLAPPRA